MQKNREPLKIEDTNMALAGSEVEKKVKLAAAEQEPSWIGAGKAPGIEIWRIEKFNVVPWPKADYGKFYDGDSYIVLSTTKQSEDSEKLLWDVHFWLGAHTTSDEAGTAAYKTVELDDLLGGMPVQHRQVQGHEEMCFLQLFPDGMKILQGGIDSGFKHVEAGAGNEGNLSHRLFHIKGTNMKNSKSIPVPLKAASLNEGDAFVLDAGKDIFIFQGATCSPGERMSASRIGNEIADNRRGGKAHVVSSDDAPEGFWGALGGKPADGIPADGAQPADGAAEPTKKLFKLSDSSGEMQFSPVAEVKKDQLNSDDVFVLDAVHTVFVWVGKGASSEEKMEAMPRAQQYLNEVLDARSKTLPISRVVEGHERANFVSVFG